MLPATPANFDALFNFRWVCFTCHTHTHTHKREIERLRVRGRNSSSALGAKRNYLQKMKQIKQAKVFPTCPQESVIRLPLPSPLPPYSHTHTLYRVVYNKLNSLFIFAQCRLRPRRGKWQVALSWQLARHWVL